MKNKKLLLWILILLAAILTILALSRIASAEYVDVTAESFNSVYYTAGVSGNSINPVQQSASLISSQGLTIPIYYYSYSFILLTAEILLALVFLGYIFGKKKKVIKIKSKNISRKKKL